MDAESDAMSAVGGSDAQSEPPEPATHSIPASQHDHPVWRRARGAEGGAKPRGSAASASGQQAGPRYCPISMAELEMRARAEGDGADSALFSDEEEEEEAETAAGKKRKHAGTSKGATKRPSPAMQMASAAFGAGAFDGAEEEEDGFVDDDSACESASMTSGAVREAYRNIFPVKGIHCVGCAAPARMAKVDEFVAANCTRMQETSLYKMAALVYEREVAAPARREGAPAPPWAWKDVRGHYSMHVVNPRMARYEAIRTLAAMRKTLEMRLLREDDSGDRSLDRTNGDLMLKVVALQSKEISLLHAEGTAKPGTAGPPPRQLK